MPLVRSRRDRAAAGVVRTALAGCCAAAVAAPASFARADVLPPPPEDCPAGAIGASSHHGEWCEASVCTTDADCSGQVGRSQTPRTYVCREVDLCVRTETYTVTEEGVVRDRTQPPRTWAREIGVGDCGSACTAPATCTTAKRCVETTTSTLRRVGGCGTCVAARGRRADVGAAVALASGIALGSGWLARRGDRARRRGVGAPRSRR